MEKQIKISLDIAKKMLDSNEESLKEIALLNFPELDNKEKEWKDFGKIGGYYITSSCDIYKIESNSTNNNKNLYPTKKEAEAALAMSQLLQWRDRANGEPLESWYDLTDFYNKFYIYKEYNDLKIGFTFKTFSSLSFKTREITEQFLKDHKTLLETALLIKK